MGAFVAVGLGIPLFGIVWLCAAYLGAYLMKEARLQWIQWRDAEKRADEIAAAEARGAELRGNRGYR